MTYHPKDAPEAGPPPQPDAQAAAVDASIVIRTYNEGKWLGDALKAVAAQNPEPYSYEVVIVDSGSTDDTLKIAEAHGCRITHIKKSEFTFGRSLNMGCEAAIGRFLVFISGHCIPSGERWLHNLVKPLDEGVCAYTYGRQMGKPGITKFSEEQLFRKYFPDCSHIPQDDFFCNNANSAILTSVWKSHPFDETVTGLEDMALAKQLVADGMKIGYVADAPVIHIHEESWSKVKTRYEREAVALQDIMPEVHVGFGDFVRYTLAGIMHDWGEALDQRVFWKEAGNIVMFRFNQYWGSYQGNNNHRKLSQRRKDRYFYPR
ncbi:glycosyltransferase [Alkalicaulis satelles]|uniref:glycosyltransferase n=1 Tax=Alkalicaulis satelles TaxID=2609175 RepID=UPI001E468199|nr:glycosyltransferase family 2 protein [Alkalicaulis satelles]